MGTTTISWTDESSNPIRFRRKDNGKMGWACVKKSQGCSHCYSERTNKWVGTGLDFTVPNMNLVEPYIVEKEIARLLKLRGPRRIFICDMTDLFGEFIPNEMIFQVLAVIAICKEQTFQVLTKRADRLEKFFSDPETPNTLEQYTDALFGQYGFCSIDFEWPLLNLHIGVTVEDSTQYPRIDHLLKTPATARYVSCEPLLSALDLSPYLKCQWELDKNHPVGWGIHDYVDREQDPHRGYPAVLRPRLDLIIAGFETGARARPGHLNWVRGLRDQCLAAGVPFHFKSWGEWIPITQIADLIRDEDAGHPVPGWYAREDWKDAVKGAAWGCLDANGNFFPETTTWDDRQESPIYDHEVTIYRVGRKASGRLLDGKTWDGAIEMIEEK